MSVKFDRFRLSLPSDFVEILKADEFTHVLKYGEVTHLKYEQKTPFYYQIMIDTTKNRTYLEFSGKCLLENYPDLISTSNISECFANINHYEICHIDPTVAVEYATVCQCDVTADISYSGSMRELHNNLMIRNNRSYAVTVLTSNRFSIQNTLSTNRKRERMIVYDKAEEINTKSNQSFLQAISNREDQLEYFSDKIRLELNLNSVDRMRKYLGISELSLHSVLNSKADPIEGFLMNALNCEDTLLLLKHKTPKLRSLEHLLLMCLCDFNLSQLERVVRDTIDKNYSITNTMAPYKALYEKVRWNTAQPETEVYFIELRNRIKWAVTKFLDTDCSYVNKSLTHLYSAQKRCNCDANVDSETSIFDISMPRLPNL